MNRDVSPRRMTLLLVACLLCVGTGVAPLVAAEIVTLDGATRTADIVSVDKTQLQWKSGEQTGTLPLSEILTLRWPDHPSAPPAALQLTTTDGGRYALSSAVCDGLTVTATSPVLGELQIPLAATRTLQLAPLEPAIREQWIALQNKPATDDRLVIRKGDVLDFLPGVITEFNAETVNFLYQGSEIPVRRSKVFGILFPRQRAEKSDSSLMCRTTQGDRIPTQSISIADDMATLQLAGENRLQLPLTAVREIDYSSGRLAYLSDLDPDGVEHTPYFDTIWMYQRDQTSTAGPLKLNRVHYPKGLWIHSRTRLTYRLNGEYKQFQAICGIDDAVAFKGLGHVELQILADDRVLYERVVTGQDEPEKIELDLTDVRFLKIVVDFGEGLDIGDHLVLGDAKLIK